MATVAETQVEALLDMAEADAWAEYLHDTRSQPKARYAEVEPWAWARLKQRLRAITARRHRYARTMS